MSESNLPERDEAVIAAEIFGKRPPQRARFFLHGAKDEDASLAAGYPVYVDKVYVAISVPDSKDFVSRPAKGPDFREFAEAAAKFERAKNWAQHSLELLPGITTAQLATAHALGLFTIEQLAAHTPDNAPWAKLPDGDPFPNLAGQLPPALEPAHVYAKRFVAFANKPRLRLVDGTLQEVS
jgi:hypothetical protein